MTASWSLDRDRLLWLAGGVASGFLLGGAIAAGAWIVPIAAALAGTLLLAVLRLEAAMVVLCLGALLQVPLVGVGPVEAPTLVELLAPLLLAAVALRAVAAPAWSARALADRETPGAVRVANLALVVLAGVLAVGLVRSATSPDLALGEGLPRVFYGYAVALVVYALLYATLVRGTLRFSVLQRWLLGLAVAMSALGLLAVVLGLPLSLGNVRYSVVDYASGAVRVGFLETFAIVGAAFVVVGRVERWRAAAGLLFAAALIASGGRAAVLGVLVAVVAYLALSGRGVRLTALAALAALAIWTLPVLDAFPQAERLADVGSASFESGGRALIYERSFAAFAEQPLLGTGVGAPVTVHAASPELVDFYTAQLSVGGHATYAALLKNFGLAGLVPFLVALGAVLIGLAGRLRDDSLAGFFFVFLLAEAVVLVASGNGSDPAYYIPLAGGAATLTVRRRAGGPLPAPPSPPRARSSAGSPRLPP